MSKAAAGAAPGTYRLDDATQHYPIAWTHEETGLRVELHRWGRYKTARSRTRDHWEYRIRASRPDGESAYVARTTERGPWAFVTEWFLDHADGTVDLEAEALEAWET